MGSLRIQVLALLVAATAGVAMAFQGTLNAMLGKVAGLWETTSIVHAVGLVLAGVLFFAFRIGDGSLTVRAPWYAYLNGFTGVLIIYGVPWIYLIPTTTPTRKNRRLPARLHRFLVKENGQPSFLFPRGAPEA